MLEKFKALSRVAKVGLISGGIVLFGIAAGSQQTPKPASLTSQNTANTTSQATHKPVIVTKEVTETQVIPFPTSTISDSTLSKGQTTITTAGADGKEILSYKVTFTDGKQTAKNIIRTVITKEPVTQITAIGTYVPPPQLSCPAGTYVNSAGDTVCSPYQSTSAPAGATAQCTDGSYSFSQSRSGTCSHHGGVASWL